MPAAKGSARTPLGPIFSDQIEVKHEFDNFIFEEANQGRNDEEYSEHEDDHISDHIETQLKSGN